MKKYIFVSAFTNIVSPNNRTSSIIGHVDGEKVVLTTDFNHGKKMYYVSGEADNEKQIVLHVPAYQNNLSLQRIWSHLVFAWKVREYLNALSEEPEAVYCAMPTSSSAYVCAKYCKKHGIKYVIDVIDLWPDSLLPLVKGQKVIKGLLIPWAYLTQYAYRHADVIMGESVKYAYEAKKYNTKANVYPIYLGIDTSIISKIKTFSPVHLEKPSDEIWIAYAGSLGVSYDFQTLLEAIKFIDGKYRYKLWFIGDGMRRDEILEYIERNQLNAEITGFLKYELLLGYLGYCDIAVNIFRANTKVVYSYKFNDYVAMNCFVLNSLEGETAEMVDEYQIGLNFNFSDKPLSSVLEDTLAHWSEYAAWRGNNQRLVGEKLDKEKIYSVVKKIFK